MSEDEIINKFKKCEVADFLENGDVTTTDWVKDGILDIIKKQKKENDKLKKSLEVCENELIKERKNRIKLQDEVDVLVKSYDKALDMLVQRDDKIKNKIKELEEEGTTQYWDNKVKKMLQELLGDDNK